MEIPYKTYHAFEKLKLFKNENIQEELTEMLSILDALILIQQAVVDSKIKVSEWEVYKDTLASKFILHSNSIIWMAHGQKLSSHALEKVLNIFDLPSMYVLLRSLLECFLLFDFIYIQPLKDSEKEFRFWNWKYESLKRRIKFNVMTKPLLIQKENDRKEILELQEKISRSEYFSQFTEKQKEKILKTGDSKLFKSWEDLMISSKLNMIIFETIYPVLSSYAHTGMHSLMNFSEQQIGFSEKHSTCHLLLYYSKLIMCLFTSRYKGSFIASELKYNMLNLKTRLDIEFYCKQASIQ